MGRIRDLLKRVFKGRAEASQLDKNSIEELFSELEEVQLKKERISHYLDELNRREKAYIQYENLDDEAVSRINVLAQRAKEIEERKNNLKGRLISTNAALGRLTPYEEQLPELIKEMQVAEKRRRETESHIMYLEDERTYLEDERESLLMGYRFLKGFSLFIVCLLSVCLLISFVMLQVLREKIWFILSIIVIFAMVFVVGLVLAKEKLETRIKNNGILQQKAVKYLNKSKIRLFNQTKYLEYQYHKLGVDSAAKLELYYNRYLKSKNNEAVYLKMNDKLGEIEEDILEILHSKNILLEDIGDLTDWILQPKGLNEMKMIQDDRDKTREQLEALETYEKEIWKDLSVLSEDEELNVQIQEKLAQYSGENMLDKNRQSE